jgi:hypothetical protein
VHPCTKMHPGAFWCRRVYIYILLYDAFSKEDVRIPKLEFYVALSKKSLGWCIHRAFNVDGGRAGGINRRHASSFS